MAAVPPFFNPIAFPNISLAERFLAAYWASAKEEYRWKQKAALKALDTTDLRVVTAKLQESIDETIRFKTELEQTDINAKKDVVNKYIQESGANIRQYMSSSASVASSRITAFGGIERDRLESQRDLRRATMLGLEAETELAKSRGDREKVPHDSYSKDTWGQLWSDPDLKAPPVEWNEQARKYEVLLATLQDQERTTDPVRQQWLGVRLWQQADELGHFAGASRVAALTMGDISQNVPLRGGGRIELQTDLRRWFIKQYGPITTQDTAESRAVIRSAGGVGRAEMPSLADTLAVSGLDDDLDLSQYNTRIGNLQKEIARNQQTIQEMGQAAAMVVSGTAGFSPWTVGPTRQVPGARAIDALGALWQSDRQTARRVIDDVSRGQFDVENSLSVFSGWADDAIQARAAGTGSAEQGRLGNHVHDYLSSELSSIAQEARSAKNAQQIENVRQRFLALGEAIRSPLIQGQVGSLSTPRGRSLTDVYSQIESGIEIPGRDVLRDIRAGARGMSRLISNNRSRMSEQESELAWLPYQYEDRLSGMSKTMASGDQSSYAEQALQFRADLEPLSADLAGDAGVAIRDQVDLAEQSGNYDMLNARMEELRTVIQGWINAAAQQSAGISEVPLG